MAGIGEKIYDVDSQTFQQLDQQINDTNTGLAGKVSQLEATSDLSNVNQYDPAKSYVAGNLALVDGRLQRANKATTGALKLADWEDPSPVAAVTANRAMVSDDEGKPIASDVTDVELSKIRGGAPIEDDDITDSDAFLHNDAGTMKQTGLPALWRWITDKVTGAASTILTDDLTPDKLLRTDADGKVVEAGVRIFDASNRMRQDSSVTNIASDDRDILTKKDGDSLYADKVSIGYLQQTSAKSDDWTTICDLGVIAIQARNPTSSSSDPVRVFNKTGQTLTHLWDLREPDGSFRNGATGNSNNNYFTIGATSDSRRVWGLAYYNGNGSQVNGGAWSYEVAIHRIGSDGYRIAAKLQSN